MGFITTQLLRSLVLGGVLIASTSAFFPANFEEQHTAISSRDFRPVWTYDFGEGDFLKKEWQKILQPPAEEDCVIVVQVKDSKDYENEEDLTYFFSPYFPYCRTNTGQATLPAGRTDLAPLTWVKTPDYDNFGHKFYVLGGLTSCPNDHGETDTTVCATRIQKFVNTEEQALGSNAIEVIKNIKNFYRDPKIPTFNIQCLSGLSPITEPVKVLSYTLGDRAHRIGQTKQVHVYRFITKDTIEERINKRAMQKLKLDQMIIAAGGAQQAAGAPQNQEELLDMIQHGADKIRNSPESMSINEAIDNLIREGEETTTALNREFAGLSLDALITYQTKLRTKQLEGKDYSKPKAGRYNNPRDILMLTECFLIHV